MSDSKFRDDEIELERRKSVSRAKNIDDAKIQAAFEMVRAARTEEPEVFEARLKSQGLDPKSERGKAAMAQYWIIRRGQHR